jgi:glycerol-3-phosphate dehydrogenase
MMLKFDVVIVGGGATGTSILRDLAMRGLKACLAERNEISSGTTSHSHQNLVGGMRYVVKDPPTAEECARENKIIAKIAPQIVSSVKNYFVGFKNEYTERALDAAKDIGVHFKVINPKNAFRENPLLNPKIDIVIETEDRNINATEFCKLNCESAIKRNGVLLEHTSVKDIKKENVDEYVIFTNHGKIVTKYIVNATGAWANQIANKLGITLPLLYNQGTIIIQKSLSPRGLQHFRQPGDGDAYIVHNEFTWIGTTSTTINSPEEAKPEPWAERYLKDEFSVILPGVINEKTISTLVGIRPLLKTSNIVDGRGQSRDFRIIENPENLFHIIGGKLTTARLMAEKISDKICKKQGIKSKCTTAKITLGS